MFGKLSRYRDVPLVTVPDGSGRVVTATDFRPLPEVTGTFAHTVDAGDRLDQLAWSYYGRPQEYWHICDANPGFLSPLALLGQEPLATTRFPLTAPPSGPPWGAALAALAATTGVEDATVEEIAQLVPERRTVGGQQVTVTVERWTRALTVTHNRLNATQEALSSVIAGTGFTVGPPVPAGRVGQPVTIPPAVSG
jgi:Phage Tail Protein X